MTELDERVTRLEIEMAEVRQIAEHASREVAHVPAVLRGHTRVLNALRKTQREHGERIDRLEHKVDEGFAEMHEGFAEMREGFRTTAAGMSHITHLLTHETDRSDQD